MSLNTNYFTQLAMRKHLKRVLCGMLQKEPSTRLTIKAFLSSDFFLTEELLVLKKIENFFNMDALEKKNFIKEIINVQFYR